MDIQILRAIVQSRSEVMKDVEDPEGFDRSLKENKFPPTDSAVLTALSRSFANLLSYKVSPEAYQRYSVRIQVIEVLRDWLRPPGGLESSRTFCQSGRLMEFTARILRVSLRNEILFRNNENIDVLISLARALMCILPRNKSFVTDLEMLLEKIVTMSQTEQSQRLVVCAVKEKGALGLSFPTVERLYICQSAKLIEEPLTDIFVDNLTNSNDDAVLDNFKSSFVLEELLKIVAESPTIFQIASSILKEIFVYLKYSPRVSDYIKFFLTSLRYHCQGGNKKLVDLYPIRLQSCILLLDIEPEQHSQNSRDYVLKCLEKINSSNPNETLILMSHFPSWLQSLGTYLEHAHNVMNISVDSEL